jgi:hypothetical protein
MRDDWSPAGVRYGIGRRRSRARSLQRCAGEDRSLASGRAERMMPANAHECALRKPFRDASRSRGRERLHAWPRTDLLASSGVAVVTETLYLALSSRLGTTVVVPLG